MNIKISPFSESDITDRVNLINNPSIHKHMFFDLPVSNEKTKLWYESLKERKDRIDFVARTYENEIVSMFGLTNIDLLKLNSELYIIIAPEFQGKGIGIKMTQWLINYGFLKYGINKIYLIIDNENIAASKVYQKCGFNIEASEQSQKIKCGKCINITLMSLFLTDWINKDWKQEKINFEINI